VYHCAQLSYTAQYKTVLITFPFILQTIVIAEMMSTGCDGERLSRATHYYYAKVSPVKTRSRSC